MTSDAQRRAHRKLAEAREAAGKRSVTVWLSEPARKALDGLAAAHGSRERAIEEWLCGAAPAAAEMVVMPKPPPKRATLDTKTEHVKPFKTRLKGEWKAP